MRIVIVEDEVKIRVGMGKLIAAETGHEVIAEAKNGKEGLELIRRFKPDLVITDIRMPEMDGLEMLRAMREGNMETHAVILTGYAEFEYAKKAIPLGVADYLLKPIGVEDVKKVLADVAQKISQEKERYGTAESFLRDIYLSGREQSADSFQKLRAYLSTNQYEAFTLFLVYTACAPPDYENKAEEAARDIAEHNPDQEIIFSPIDKFQLILILLCEKKKGEAGEKEEVKERLERKLVRPYQGKEQHPVWAMGKLTDFSGLYGEIEKLSKLLPYGMLAQDGGILTEEGIKQVKAEEYVYPVSFSSRLKKSICIGDGEGIQKEAQEFNQYMRRHTFLPEDVKHAYVKLFTFLTNLIQEIDAKACEQLQKLSILRKMTEAYTKEELAAYLEDAAAFIINTQGKKEDIGNYTIKRAINYIREHYKEGISLEEVAGKLEITPEYLSTLFNKEMNVNYSTFLKEFRISHAKRLLKGTDLKIYEIARQVGYADPKYFIRVFKEAQGISPKEYRDQL